MTQTLVEELHFLQAKQTSHTQTQCPETPVQYPGKTSLKMNVSMKNCQEKITHLSEKKRLSTLKEVNKITRAPCGSLVVRNQTNGLCPICYFEDILSCNTYIHFEIHIHGGITLLCSIT